jgi:hypothetical protein
MASVHYRVQRLTRLYSTPVEDPWGEEVESKLATSPGRASVIGRLQRRRSEELSCHILYVEPDGSCAHRGLPLYVSARGCCFSSPRQKEEAADPEVPAGDDAMEDIDGKEAHKRALDQVHAELRAGQETAGQEEGEENETAPDGSPTLLPCSFSPRGRDGQFHFHQPKATEAA